MLKTDDIETMGEESGREEVANEYPNHDVDAPYRDLFYRGLARARELYRLKGRNARVFARNWAMGYQANCELFADEFSEEEQEEN
jgi:hypothetical protein